MKKNPVLDTLIYIVALIMVILVVIFQNKLSMVFVVLAVGALILGILTFLKKEKSGFLACGIGIGGVITYFIYNAHLLDFAKAVTFMICISIFIILIFTFIFSILNRKKVMKEYNTQIEAEVIDLERNLNTKKEYYKPIYRYLFKGMFYEVENKVYLNKHVPNIGDKKRILINNEKPSEVYFLPSKLQDIKDLCTILFLLIASLLIIVYLFV